MLKINKNNKLKAGRRLARVILSVGVVCSLLTSGLAVAEERGAIKKKSQNFTSKQTRAVSAPLEPVVVSNVAGNSSGVATTETEVFADRSVSPMLRPDSAAMYQSAIARYEAIVAQGGWPEVSAKRMKKAGKGPEVVNLKRRLIAEGYLTASALEGGAAEEITDSTQRALMLFQKRHGLAKSGKLDASTVAELNVPAQQRLATLRANLARVSEYSKDLGDRYIVVNVPALQLEAVNGGRVYSRHNVIAGKPDRPTPVVATNISDIKFNPFWNVPVSIVEKDLIPKILKEGTRTLTSQNIRVFDGYGGPEVDPSTVDWENTPADRYFFRQDPGEDNAMATVKINFPSPFGIYLHDTPTRSLFTTAARYLSSGCVRVDKVQILVNWILNGQDGWNPGRIESVAASAEPTDVKITNPPQLRVVYLTAWANDQGPAFFRPDIYDLDRSNFVVGQPLPPNEYSEAGERFVLKAPPRAVMGSAATAEIDDDGGIFDSSPGLLNRTSKQKSGTVREQGLSKAADKQAADGSAPPKQNFASATFTKKPAPKKVTLASVEPKEKPAVAEKAKKTGPTKTNFGAASSNKKPAVSKVAQPLGKNKKPPSSTAALTSDKKKKKKVVEAAATNFTSKSAANGPTFGQ